MIVKNDVSLANMKPVMRQVLREAERIWKALGHVDGVTITEYMGGFHSAASWHYSGYALDLRTNYTNKDLPGPDLNRENTAKRLRMTLPGFDVVVHSTHIHVEIGNTLAKQLGVYY